MISLLVRSETPAVRGVGARKTSEPPEVSHGPPWSFVASRFSRSSLTLSIFFCLFYFTVLMFNPLTPSTRTTRSYRFFRADQIIYERAVWDQELWLKVTAFRVAGAWLSMARRYYAPDASGETRRERAQERVGYLDGNISRWWWWCGTRADVNDIGTRNRRCGESKKVVVGIHCSKCLFVNEEAEREQNKPSERLTTCCWESGRTLAGHAHNFTFSP